MKYSELKKLLIQNGATFEKHGKKNMIFGEVKRIR